MYSKSNSESEESAPFTRLFVIGSKSLTEKDFREAFQEFGHIEEVYLVRDRNSGESKGIAYIKYIKTSEAAKALDSMNGKCIGNTNRSIKVMIAASRGQESKREANEEEKQLRLFLKVPRSMTESELEDIFKQYGSIDYVTIVKSKDTNESKGVAFVKYYKFFHAALAYEECDRSYKAVFAEPKRPNNVRAEEKLSALAAGFNAGFSGGSSSNGAALLPSFDVSNNEGYVKLNVVASALLTEDQLWKLFDIVPGLDYCQIRVEGRFQQARSVGTVVYNSPQWASHAKNKLHGFEYPPGNRLIVKPVYDNLERTVPEPHHEQQSDLLKLAETIAQATSIIQAAGLSNEIFNSKTLCSVSLPDKQPMASSEEEMEARCFVVCSTTPPPTSVLRDVFGRFGNLMDVYMLHNKNCGYVKYGRKQSAQNAIKTLHGAEIMGVKFKVLEAEERPEHNRKRPRMDTKFEVIP